MHAYAAHGMVHAAETREAARSALVEGWDRQRQAEPDRSRIILTHTNAEVRALNEEARGRLRASGDLGEDVAFGAERGERQFAPGDQIMFLRNERGMGVKNGTLGTIERVSPEGMAVRLDSGARVAFEAKDYAAVDHGYAATFHKSQGVTVDRAHLLATPGMERHSAYVGMSRHRDGVELHYGRDDFADQRQLARILSRDLAKDMAGDYAAPSDEERARSFAERREIRFPEFARELVAKVRDKAKGMFAGFRPKPAAPVQVLDQERPGGPNITTPDAARQSRTIQSYARAWTDAARMLERGLPVLPHQQQALARAGDALDATRPYGARDLAAALERDPSLAHDAAEGHTGPAQRGMILEAAVRIDPDRRADRFVESWQGLARERAGSDRALAEKATTRMGVMAESLRRDPELAKVLERRASELELKQERGRSIDRLLKQSIGIGRDWDRGMSR